MYYVLEDSVYNTHAHIPWPRVMQFNLRLSRVNEKGGAANHKEELQQRPQCACTAAIAYNTGARQLLLIQHSIGSRCPAAVHSQSAFKFVCISIIPPTTFTPHPHPSPRHPHSKPLSVAFTAVLWQALYTCSVFETQTRFRDAHLLCVCFTFTSCLLHIYVSHVRCTCVKHKCFIHVPCS